MARVSKHYINNKRLYETYVKYFEDVKKAEEEGKPKPQMPNYIAEAVIQISHNLAKKPSFSAYPFKEDMIASAILNCTRYFDKYNLDYKNPFAYITQIVKNSFIKKINDEKKILVLKHKYLSAHSSDGSLVTQQPSDTNHYYIRQSTLDSEYMNELVDTDNKSREKENE